MTASRTGLTLFAMTMIGLLASIALYKLVYYDGGTYQYSLNHYFGRDFANLYLGGRLALENKIDILGNIVEYNKVVMKEFGWPHGDPDRDFFVYSYPPHMLFLSVLFGYFDYTTSLYLWSLISAVFMYHAAARITDGDYLLAMIIVLSPGFLSNLFQANTGAIFGSLLALALWHLRERPVISGICLGLLSIKPQLAIVIGAIALYERNWRVLLSALATTGLLLLATYLMLGKEPFQMFFGHTLRVQMHILREMDENLLFPLFVTSPFVLFYRWGLPYGWAMILQWFIAIMAIGFAIRVWSSHAPKKYRVAIALIATAFASPYINHYDLTVLSLAVLAWHSAMTTEHGVPGNDRIMLLLWIFPAISLSLNVFSNVMLNDIVNSNLLLIGLLAALMWNWGRWRRGDVTSVMHGKNLHTSL